MNSHNLRTALEAVTSSLEENLSTLRSLADTMPIPDIREEAHGRIDGYIKLIEEARQTLATPDAPDAERVGFVPVEVTSDELWGLRDLFEEIQIQPEESLRMQNLLAKLEEMARRQAIPAPVPGDERAGFEAWALSQVYDIDRVKGAVGDNDYYRAETRYCYAAWTARAALSAPPDVWIARATELRTLLNYVFYARLPIGDKVEDHIPDEWALRVITALSEPLPPPPVAGTQEEGGAP